MTTTHPSGECGVPVLSGGLQALRPAVHQLTQHPAQEDGTVTNLVPETRHGLVNLRGLLPGKDMVGVWISSDSGQI